MDRVKRRLDVAVRALDTLRELAFLQNPSEVQRDSAIQRFEYSVEASWKAAQAYLSVVEGLEEGSPKSCIRACRQVGLLDDVEATLGLEMVDDRNATVHTYSRALAEKIFSRLSAYSDLLAAWLRRMGESLSGKGPDG